MGNDIFEEVANLPTENSKSIYVVFNVCRQIQGEYVFVKTEKAFRNKAKAEAFVLQLQKQQSEPDGRPKLIKLKTEFGFAECLATINALEIELED